MYVMLVVEHQSGYCEPSTAAGVNEERMNGRGRRVPATGANSKIARRAVMGAQWRGEVWHTPYYRVESRVIFEGVCAWVLST